MAVGQLYQCDLLEMQMEREGRRHSRPTESELRVRTLMHTQVREAFI